MILNTTYNNPSNENIKSLVDYLISVSGKELTLACIRQNIFKTKKWSSKDGRLTCRCHVKVAVTYLNHLISNEKSYVCNESVKTTIADILPIIKKLDPIEDCSFVLCSTNSLPTRLHYKQAEWLFYKNQLPPDASRRYDIDVLVLYALRLSFEKRIMGFLGIDYLQSNGKPVGLSRILPLVAKLKNVRFEPNINWEEMKLVNNWLNHFMHRHLRPFPWVIHQAFEVLNPLLLPGKIIDGKTIYASHYASTFVQTESKLESEIEKNFSSSIPNLEIKWSGKREILLAKNHE